MSRQTTKRHVKMTDLFDIKGKIAVMTGSTGVLGKGIASYLASQGCTMLLLCREQSKDKAEAIVEAIRRKAARQPSMLPMPSTRQPWRPSATA